MVLYSIHNNRTTHIIYIIIYGLYPTREIVDVDLVELVSLHP